MSSASDGSGVASGPSRLCRTHRRASTFVDFNHVASGVCAAREAFETPRASRDDRVGVVAGLDHVTLVDLLVEERVEGVPARAEGIDLTHEREYRKSGFALIGRFAAGGLENEDFAGDVGGDVGLGEEGPHRAAGRSFDGVAEAGFHRSLEGVSRLADGLELSCLDERAFGRGVDVLEKTDDVVFAENGADAV